MLDAKQVDNTNIYEMFIVGEVTKEDVDRVRGRFDEAMKKHGNIRLLEVVEKVGKIEPSAFWSDARFAWRHRGDFAKVAVVSQKTWVKAFTKVTGLFSKAKVRYFDMADLEEARGWLRED